MNKSHIGGDSERLGELIIEAHMDTSQELVDLGVPHQFYDHIHEMV